MEGWIMRRNQWLAILLCAAMLVSLLPTLVWAEELPITETAEGQLEVKTEPAEGIEASLEEPAKEDQVSTVSEEPDDPEETNLVQNESEQTDSPEPVEIVVDDVKEQNEESTTPVQEKPAKEETEFIEEDFDADAEESFADEMITDSDSDSIIEEKRILRMQDIPAGALQEDYIGTHPGSRRPGAKRFPVLSANGFELFADDEDHRTRDENGDYVFETFEELKELTRYEYANYTEAYYVLNQSFRLEEDLQIPKNLAIHVHVGSLTVPAGITLTIAEDAFAEVDDLTVEGTIINRGLIFGYVSWQWNGGIDKSSVLRVTGSIENYDTIEYPVGVSGLENIHNYDQGHVILDHTFAKEAELVSMISAANADSDVNHWYEGYAYHSFEIYQELELPVDCAVYVPYVTLTIGDRGILRTTHDDTYMSYIQAYDGGTIVIDGSLVNNSGMDVYSPSKLVRIAPFGFYSGTGWLGVEDTGADPFTSLLEGFHKSEFITSHNDETSFWVCILVNDENAYTLNVKELQLLPGEFYELSGAEKATGRKVAVSAASDNTSVASVESGTVVSGVKVGRATITATIGEEQITIPVIVMFWDVADSEQYFFNPVYWAVEKGVTAGTSPVTFSPGKTCTRGQIVTFLWKALGSPEPSSTDNPFTDVKTTDYFYKPVLWAKENGVTAGTSATTFSPGNACTRGQIVTFLWKALGSPEPSSTDNPFTDVKTTDYFYKPVLWAKEKSVTSGTSAISFSPGKSCTRAQAMTFLYKAVA